MSKVKDIRLKVIPSKIANDFVRNHHYSKRVSMGSNLHFGVFNEKILHGVMSYGSPIDKRKVIGLVEGTKWNEMLELNRMAFDDYLPKNSESRCLSVSFKLINKYAPHIKWILSFADGTQCGDGTIYRASGFILTNINKNKTIGYSDNMKRIVAKHGQQSKKHGKITLLPGYQLRYIKFIKPKERENLTVPEIPYSMIKEMGIGMYKGDRLCLVGEKKSQSAIQQEVRGAIPTTRLQLNAN